MGYWNKIRKELFLHKKLLLNTTAKRNTERPVLLFLHKRLLLNTTIFATIAES